ncbi:MAG TPA: carotenoid biosynthesis protein [Ignavibacteria bacterium]|nr:carotenoid biosynthesis protein [Ignavibacteria bacterium]
MENIPERNKFFLILYVFFLVGIAGHYTESFYGLMLTLTPYILLLMGIFVLIFSGVFRSSDFMKWFAYTYMLTLLLEVIGVKTGMIFGDYIYGDVLGFKLFGVPLIIGFNWLFVIAGAFSVSSRISSNKIIIVSLSAVFSVLFDYLLEPVAMKLGYWEWKDSIIPVQNYAAWFIISLTASAGLVFFKSKNEKEYNLFKNTNMFLHYFFAQIIFFLALNFR